MANNRGGVNTVVVIVLWVILAFGIAIFAGIFVELSKRGYTFENEFLNKLVYLPAVITGSYTGNEAPGDLDGAWINRVDDPQLSEFVKSYLYIFSGDDFVWRRVGADGDTSDVGGTYVISGETIVLAFNYPDSGTDVQTYDFSRTDDTITIGSGDTVSTGTFAKTDISGRNRVENLWRRLIESFSKDE